MRGAASFKHKCAAPCLSATNGVQYDCNPPEVRGGRGSWMSRWTSSLMLAERRLRKKRLASSSFFETMAPLIGKPHRQALERKPCSHNNPVPVAACSMGGIMGAGTKMMAAGLSMGQVQSVTRETIAYAREKIGDDAVGEIVGAIPGLSQFV